MKRNIEFFTPPFYHYLRSFTFSLARLALKKEEKFSVDRIPIQRNCCKKEFFCHCLYTVPVWSGVNIDGVMLMDLNPQIGTESDRENWNEIHKKVIMR